MIYLNKSHTGLDQTTADQHLLVPDRGTIADVLGRTLAVTFTDLRIFLRDVQSVEQLTGGQHVEGLLVDRIGTAEHGVVGRTAETVKSREQLLAIVELVKRDALQRHGLDVISIRFDRSVGPPQLAGEADITPRLVAASLGQTHVGRHRRVTAAQFLGQERAD